MNNYVLSCESTVDLTAQHLIERDIKFLCYHYELDGKEFIDDLGLTVDYEKFYKAMADGAMTKTSQINVEVYRDYFEQFLKDGKDVVHMTLSGGITGTVNSARIARSLLEEDYPDRKIYIVDTLGACAGSGFLADAAADKRDEGMSADGLFRWIEDNKLKVHHWFFSTDLTYYIRGGRISKTSGFVGKLLNICPLLNFDGMGKLVPREKVRSKKRVIDTIVKRMEENADGGLEYSGKCYIAHSACYEDARAVADLVEERFKNLDGKVQITYIGTTIGSHTGPGTVALFFWGAERPVE